MPWACIPSYTCRLSILNLCSRARLTCAQATAQQSPPADRPLASTQARLRAPFSPMALPAESIMLVGSGLGSGSGLSGHLCSPNDKSTSENLNHSHFLDCLWFSVTNSQPQMKISASSERHTTGRARRVRERCGSCYRDGLGG